MNWKKALLGIVILGFALVLFVFAIAGVTATAAVVAIAESGVVEPVFEAVADVVDEAERVRIEVDGPEFTITDPDSGRSRVIVSGMRTEGERFVVSVPEITITDPDSGNSRVIAPELPRRVPRVFVDGEEHVFYWHHNALAPLGFLFRGITTLLAIVLVATGAWLLLRNRRPAKDKVKTT